MTRPSFFNTSADLAPEATNSAPNSVLLYPSKWWSARTKPVPVASTILPLLGPVTKVEADPNFITAPSPSTAFTSKPSATRIVIILDSIDGFSGMKSVWESRTAFFPWLFCVASDVGSNDLGQLVVNLVYLGDGVLVDEGIVAMTELERKGIDRVLLLHRRERIKEELCLVVVFLELGSASAEFRAVELLTILVVPSLVFTRRWDRIDSVRPVVNTLVILD